MIKIFKTLLNAKRSILNISSMQSLSIISLLTTIVLTPFILHRIGSNQYAVWVILNTLIGYFGFSKIGFATKMLKDISAAGEERHSSIVSSVFFSVLAVQVVFLPILVFAANWLKVFIDPSNVVMYGQVIASFYFLYFAFFFTLLAGVFATIFYSKNKHYAVNACVAVRTVLNFLLIIVIGSIWGLNILILSAVTGGLSFGYLVYLYFQAKKLMDFRISFQSFDFSYIKKAFIPSLQYFLVSIGALIIYQSDTLIIASFLGAGAVTTYALGFRSVEIPQRMIWNVADVMFPKISHFYENKLWSDLSQVIKKIFIVIIPLNILLSLFLFIFGQKILAIWVGHEYVVAKNVLNIIILSFFIQTITHVYAVIINAIGQQREIAYVIAVEALLNIAISIYLVGHMGVIGVALGTLVAHVCATGWFAMYLTHRELNPVMNQKKV